MNEHSATFKTTNTRWHPPFLIGLPGLGLLALGLGNLPPDDPHPYPWFLFGGCCLLGLVILSGAVALTRSRVELTPQALIIRNMWTSHRFDIRQVSRFELRRAQDVGNSIKVAAIGHDGQLLSWIDAVQSPWMRTMRWARSRTQAAEIVEQMNTTLYRMAEGSVVDSRPSGSTSTSS